MFYDQRSKTSAFSRNLLLKFTNLNVGKMFI
jgi:hypothetical protein